MSAKNNRLAKKLLSKIQRLNSADDDQHDYKKNKRSYVREANFSAHRKNFEKKNFRKNIF